MLDVLHFTKPEIEYILENANFTEREERVFLLKNRKEGVPTIIEIAEILNCSTSTVSRDTRKIVDKIIRIL